MSITLRDRAQSKFYTSDQATDPRKGGWLALPGTMVCIAGTSLQAWLLLPQWSGPPWGPVHPHIPSVPRYSFVSLKWGGLPHRVFFFLQYWGLNSGPSLEPL
jgi:hypothetical protein